jgi:hypothetical protein
MRLTMAQKKALTDVERMQSRERKRHNVTGMGAAKPGTLLKQQILVRIF